MGAATSCPPSQHELLLLPTAVGLRCLPLAPPCCPAAARARLPIAAAGLLYGLPVLYGQTAELRSQRRRGGRGPPPTGRGGRQPPSPTRGKSEAFAGRLQGRKLPRKACAFKAVRGCSSVCKLLILLTTGK